MSYELENLEHEQVVEETTEDVVKWLKVIAYILADMQNLDHKQIYEDI